MEQEEEVVVAEEAAAASLLSRGCLSRLGPPLSLFEENETTETCSKDHLFIIFFFSLYFFLFFDVFVDSFFIFFIDLDEDASQ